MRKNSKQIGEILIEKGLVSPESLHQALAEQKRKSGEFLGSILIRRRSIKEQDLLDVLSEQYGYPIISLEYKFINWDFVKQFSASLILDYKCFPVSQDEYSVTMAIVNPLDSNSIQKAQEAARGLRLNLMLVAGSDMQKVIERYQEEMRRKSQ